MNREAERFSGRLSARDVRRLFIFVVTATGGMSIAASSVLSIAGARNAGGTVGVIDKVPREKETIATVRGRVDGGRL